LRRRLAKLALPGATQRHPALEQRAIAAPNLPDLPVTMATREEPVSIFAPLQSDAQVVDCLESDYSGAEHLDKWW
jgi:hypothetical protein